MNESASSISWPVQAVPDSTARIAIDTLSSLTLVASVPNMYFAVRNYQTASKRQKLFSAAIILLSLLYPAAPIIDLIVHTKIFDGLPNHTYYASVFGWNYPELFAWADDIIQHVKYGISINLSLQNFHSFVFYTNFRNIRVIKPFSVIWDIFVYGYIIFFTSFFLLALLYNPIYEAVGKFETIVQLTWINLAMNAFIFHFCGIMFIVILFRYNRQTRTAQVSTQIDSVFLVSGASAPSVMPKAEPATSAGIVRTLVLFMIVFWLDIVLYMIGFRITQPGTMHANTAVILYRLSTFIHPLQLGFTLGFIFYVRKLLRKWSPSKIDDTVVLELQKSSTNSTTRVITVSPKPFPPTYQSADYSFTVPSSSAISPDRANSRNQNRRSDGSAELTAPSLNNNEEENAQSIEAAKDTMTILPLNAIGTLSPVTTAESLILTVTEPFLQPSRPDEIVLHVGDKVRIDVTFQDGWALGVSHSTGRKGYFPLSCCSLVETSDDEKRLVFAPVSHISSDSLVPRTQSLESQTLSALDKPGENVQNNQSLAYAAPMLPRTETHEHTISTVLPSYLASVAPASVASTYTTPSSELLAILSHTPQRADELALIPGDRIRLTAAFDDGWGNGVNEKGEDGFFPLSRCIVLVGKSA